jgi:ectoine hydroxylase-related dioxygenase (phytanoyl-CoA dioxygenase family)
MGSIETGAAVQANPIDPALLAERHAHTKCDYLRKGWAKLPHLIGADEARELRTIAAAAASRPELQPKSSGAQADQGTAEYARILRVQRGLWRHYPQIALVVERFGALIGYINGWQQTRLWQDRVFIKAGRASGSRPTNWHQDVKLPFDRRGFATIWIALVDVPLSRGPMTFVNGSHRLGSLGAIEQLHDAKDLSELLTPEDWQMIEGCESAAPMRAGDATVHSMYTLHRAGENRDIEDRVALAISYFDGAQLYTGSPNPVTDGLGLQPGKSLEHECFPLIDGALQ